MSVSKERLGQLFILVGPGGVGKNALMNELIKETDDLWQLPTATTRPIRAGEQEGREHQFVSLDVFQKMIAEDELIEYQEVHPGKFYGVPRNTVETAIAEQQDMIADIEVLGTKIIRAQYPQNSIAIFIAPPSIMSLQERLQKRQASAEDIRDRINRLPMEMLYAPLVDYLIVNDDFDAALNDMRCIVDAVRYGSDVATDHIPKQQYFVHVDVLHDDEVLQPAPPSGIFSRQFADMAPVLAVTQLIDGILSTSIDQQHLQYARTDDQSPVGITYDPNEHTYQVTYHYSYTLPEKSTIPGFTWIKRT